MSPVKQKRDVYCFSGVVIGQGSGAVNFCRVFVLGFLRNYKGENHEISVVQTSCLKF